MKKSFKYVMLMAATLLVGFNSCSNDDDNVAGVDDSPKSVKVMVSVPSTYADEATAVGVTPVASDLQVYFTDGISIKAEGTMLPTEMAEGKLFEDVPGTASNVVIIANPLLVTSPAKLTVGTSVAELNKLMFEQSKQLDPKDKLNLFGSNTVTGNTANVILAPAISRYEIAKVEANPGAQIPLTSFELAGIYINNTYTKCGTDYTTLPTGAADILQFGPDDTEWADGTFPARYKDEFAAPTAGTSFAPDNKWAYFVMPVVAGKGTTINGELQTSIPHVILKIKNAEATGYTFAETMYVTVRDIKVAGAATTLTELTRGKVYTMALSIGGENLAPKPELPALKDITVTAEVTPWIEEPVTPVLP